MNKKFSLMAMLALALFTYSCSSDDSTVDIPTTPEEPEIPVNPEEPAADYIIPEQYAAYYQGVDFSKTGMQLKEELKHLIISTHQPIGYNTIWEATRITDLDPEGSDQLIQLYAWPLEDAAFGKREHRFVDKYFQDKGTNEPLSWNREHTFAKSLAKQDGIKGLETSNNPRDPHYIAGSDAHHLRAANKDFNNYRNNWKFIEHQGNAVLIDNPGGTGGDAKGFFPGEEWKGDVARMMMYMHIRYEDDNTLTPATKVAFAIDPEKGITQDLMLDLFLKWNAEDPVSEIEIQRNTYHSNTDNQHAQGNRNPFIDNPELANKIWGMPEYQAQNTWSK